MPAFEQPQIRDGEMAHAQSARLSSVESKAAEVYFGAPPNSPRLFGLRSSSLGTPSSARIVAMTR